jgi:hypothetical protein
MDGFESSKELGSDSERLELVRDFCAGEVLDNPLDSFWELEDVSNLDETADEIRAAYLSSSHSLNGGLVSGMS